jgi:hypothetical protein
VINLQNDEIEWWEKFAAEDKEAATEEMAHWIEEASQFYDREISSYQ